MIQKDGVDVEMLPDDWKRTGHVIQTCDFFAEKVFSCEIKINLGSEKTYQPLLCGGGSSRYILHLKSGKSIEYSGVYALCDGNPYGCKRYTKLIVDDLLKQVIDSF